MRPCIVRIISSPVQISVCQGAVLSPLAELLHTKLLTCGVVHADETGMRILDTKKCGKSRSGYLWAYVSGVLDVN